MWRWLLGTDNCTWFFAFRLMNGKGAGGQAATSLPIPSGMQRATRQQGSGSSEGGGEEEEDESEEDVREVSCRVA